MPAKNDDLHGSAPDEHPVALLLIDVINDLDFPGSEALLVHAKPMAKKLAALKRRAKEAGIPVVYVNDNYGRWQSDLSRIVEHCRAPHAHGREMVEALCPDDDDYFVVKPKHSGFYSTTLDLLLQHLRTRVLVLGGVAGDICVLFTANDAYMRDYALVVPRDCVASESAQANDGALELMERVLRADLTESERLDFAALERRAAKG